MLEISLINERPIATPMEATQENLEVLVTMLMIVAQIDIEPEVMIQETFITASAALQNPAEA
jgi:hypothetical protein|tara:strand:+ start:382 stop:567 length:186 start_codon:yes stop_codon:yes gene_type:complete